MLEAAALFPPAHALYYAGGTQLPPPPLSTKRLVE